MNWQMGAMLLPVMVHVAALVVSAAFGGQTVACENVSPIWCGTPFEHVIGFFAVAKDLNFFTALTSGFTAAWHTLSSIIILDYDILKAQQYSPLAFLGDALRIMSGMALLGLTVAGALSIIRR